MRRNNSRIAFVAELAANWAGLRRKANREKSLALILSDYPARRGRGGYAIGLDTQASVEAIVEALSAADFDVGESEPPRDLMRALEDSRHHARLSLEDYCRLFEGLPREFANAVRNAWGEPEQDEAHRDGAFHFSCFESGKLVIALQPDRGARAERRETYHDADAPPRHGYVAFYLWLRHRRAIDALIHLGTHGTLEWLPGKSAMLGEDCAPEAVLGPTPLIYPFIVNDPGEAAQAKRRACAVTIGHLTPPLEQAQLYDDAARIEQMLDEYANAAALDPRRAKLIAGAIMDEAERTGLGAECGVTRGAGAAEALAKLDAWLCDMKEMRIGDGLHVFGRARDDDAMRDACAKAEMSALLRALEGRFIEPGPAGAPSRGRVDVLPTGRNLFCIDPRHVPTRVAHDVGRRAAFEVITRHAQEHGDWPRAIMLDLWGSATIRTGGEDFAQALALLGVIPLWDNATARVVGFEIEPMAKRDFPRVDVTLHISGLFRDMFPGLIALFYLGCAIARDGRADHLGTHGTLEWLPGKSAMLGEDCAPEAVLGPTPLIYPFIINDPGEAAQAKRRACAITIGHLTPPLAQAQLYDDAARIEQMLDEYANAAALDPRRAKLIAGAIMDEADRTGLGAECGVTRGADAADALAKLDAWLCDMKEMRIGDGLHVFGRARDGDAMRDACAKAEMSALLRALAGRFIEPGPAGAPSRGRVDVLPTGRNLFCIDPRHVPTRVAYDIGRRAAHEVMTRHAQEHGDWPRAIMLDLWGSATIRTGGEDFAQALALLGVIPLWDNATARVIGFEIEPMAKRDFPRVDVTLHISGLFRDMFPGLIALFHDAVGAVAALEEEADANPLTQFRGGPLERIFGAAPGAYGLGLGEAISRGSWTTREDLGAAFLDAGGHAYDRAGESAPARENFAARVAGADALVHAQDMAEVDVLAGPAFAEFEGGFAAANRALGGAASLVHLDATRPESLRARSLREEIARVLRARVANPRWLEGQMRHGHRGAGEIAEAIDNLFAFAALGDFVSDAQFDLAFAATIGDESVREFIRAENPRAHEAIARAFNEALARGLWRSRRNSAHALSEVVDARRA